MAWPLKMVFPDPFAFEHNFHSRFEFIPAKSMEKAVKVIVKIVEMNTAN